MKNHIALIILLIVVPIFAGAADDVVLISKIKAEPLPYNEKRDPAADSLFNAIDSDAKSSALFTDFTIQFSKPVIMDEIKIINGNSLFFKKYSRVRDLEIVLYTLNSSPEKKKTEDKTGQKKPAKRKPLKKSAENKTERKENKTSPDDKLNRSIPDKEKSDVDINPGDDNQKQKKIEDKIPGSNTRSGSADKIKPVIITLNAVLAEIPKEENISADTAAVKDNVTEKETVKKSTKTDIRDEKPVKTEKAAVKKDKVKAATDKNKKAKDKPADKKKTPLKTEKTQPAKKDASRGKPDKASADKSKTGAEKAAEKKPEKTAKASSKKSDKSAKSEKVKKSENVKTAKKAPVKDSSDKKSMNSTAGKDKTAADKSPEKKIESLKNPDGKKEVKKPDKKDAVKKPEEKKTEKDRVSNETPLKKMAGVYRIENDKEGRVIVDIALKDSGENQSIKLGGEYSVTGIGFRKRDDESYRGEDASIPYLSEISLLRKGGKINISGVEDLKKGYSERFAKSLESAISGRIFSSWDGGREVTRMIFKQDGRIEYRDRYTCKKTGDSDCTSTVMPESWKIMNGKLYMKYRKEWMLWKYELDSASDMMEATDEVAPAPGWLKLFYKTDGGFSDKYLYFQKSRENQWRWN